MHVYIYKITWRQVTGIVDLGTASFEAFRESPKAVALISVDPNHLLNFQGSERFPLQEQPNMISFNVAISACDSRLRINWSTSVENDLRNVFSAMKTGGNFRERPITQT